MTDELMADNSASEPTDVDNSGYEPAENDAELETTDTDGDTGSDDDLVALLDDESDKATGAPDLVDVEYDGKTYKVPAAVKDGLMMRSDYTRKTQEVAELRKQAEEYRGLVQTSAAEMAQVISLENEFKAKFGEMSEKDWSALQESDPVKFQRLWWDRNNLIDKHRQAQTTLNHAQDEAAKRHRSEIDKAQAQAATQLKEWLPGWSEAKAREIADGAAKEYSQYGLDPSRLGQIATAAEVMILNDALAYRKLRAKAGKTKPPSAEPAPTVSTRSGGTQKDVSRMSTSEMKRHLGLPD